VGDFVLRVILPIPKFKDLEEQRREFLREGQRIANLLHKSLPGGLFDTLMACLMAMKVSDFIVPLYSPIRRDRPGRCPGCGEEDLVGEEVTIEEKWAIQEVTCSKCDRAWRMKYEFNHTALIYEPEELRG
jgi:hypothetical protein